MKNHYLNVIFIKLLMRERRMQTSVNTRNDVCIVTNMLINNTIRIM